MKILAAIAKALTAFLIAGYGLYSVAVTADSNGGSGVTRDEWVGVAVQALVAGFAVWLVPNLMGSKDEAPADDMTGTETAAPSADEATEEIPMVEPDELG